MINQRRTALYDWHIAQGAKMVPFAGYAMPVQYAEGIVKEHLWTRSQASLFDVSHMGQILIRGEDVAQALERLLPADLQILMPGQLRYSFLTNEQGTIEDDLMVTRRNNDFYLVVNAACKEADFHIIHSALPNYDVHWWLKRALLALQGPKAVEVLSAFHPDIASLTFMHSASFTIMGELCWVSRSGYTGEDGFEISLPNDMATVFADALLAHDAVKPAGLGARDSLRLEAGLCLYGNDIDTTTTPIEAGLLWAIQRSRRPNGERAGGYPGADIIGQQINAGVQRQRVGLRIEGRVPVRAHTLLKNMEGKQVGEVTSGGFVAQLNAPVAMAYVDKPYDVIGTKLTAIVRRKDISVEVVSMPFITKDYKK